MKFIGGREGGFIDMQRTAGFLQIAFFFSDFEKVILDAESIIGQQVYLILLEAAVEKQSGMLLNLGGG